MSTCPFWLLPVLDGKANLVLTPCPSTKGIDLVASLLQFKRLSPLWSMKKYKKWGGEFTTTV